MRLKLHSLLTLITSDQALPDANTALDEPNGLVCAGLDLSANRLRQAYQNGLFPWFSEGQPVLWWSPNPRMVLIPNEFRLHRSLKKVMRERLRSAQWEIRVDTDFAGVMTACAAARNGQSGTWITAQIISAYTQLHHEGNAHSIEVWQSNSHQKHTLVGGLYGVALGKIFFGESMFTLVPDASKTALAWLVDFLKKQNCPMIDCQQKTQHLGFMGAKEISRSSFIAQTKLATGMADIVFPKGCVPTQSLFKSAGLITP